MVNGINNSENHGGQDSPENDFEQWARYATAKLGNALEPVSEAIADGIIDTLFVSHDRVIGPEQSRREIVSAIMAEITIMPVGFRRAMFLEMVAALLNLSSGLTHQVWYVEAGMRLDFHNALEDDANICPLCGIRARLLNAMGYCVVCTSRVS